jgi:hypothetical protein
MGVPTSEVGYTIATTGRETTKVKKKKKKKKPSCSVRTDGLKDRQMDRQTDMWKLIVAFRGVTNVAKHGFGLWAL